MQIELTLIRKGGGENDVRKVTAMCVQKDMDGYVLRFINPDGDFTDIRVDKRAAADLVRLLLEKMFENM